MTDRPLVSPDWREGRVYDRWMLVHLMSGVAGGFSNVYFGLSAPVVVAIGLGLMVLWEGVEVLAGIAESWENRLIDLAFGLVGVALALLAAARLGRRAELWAFWVSLVVFAVGDFLGWLAYRRRTRA